MTRRTATLLIGVCVLLQARVGQAQISFDGSIRQNAPSGSLTGPAYVIPGDAGNLVGNKNLFHSFGQFNLHTVNGVRESATFTAPSGANSIANIISRVTGGQRSVINGLIDSSAMSGANFYFLNPAGVLFGANAALNVGGSFHVSTADYLLFEKGEKFVADTSTGGLTVSAPVAFGFLSPAPVRIAIEGSSLNVGAGKTLSVVSGQAPFAGETETGLKIAGPPQLSPEFVPLPTVGAPGGTIRIVSVASAGEVALAPGVNVSATPAPGRIQISGGAVIDASGAPGSGSPGGIVDIHGSQIEILADPLLGGVRIDASGDPLGGSNGTIRIHGGRLFADGAVLSANNSAEVDGAPVAIDLSLQNDIVLTNGTFVSSLAFAGGKGGKIAVDTGSFTLSAGAIIGTASLGAGKGGDIAIDASESVSLSGGAFMSSDTAGTGDGGQIGIHTPSLSMGDLATIASSNFGFGHGGPIVVDVQNLAVTGGAAIRSVTGIGDAVGGDIIVTATQQAVLSGIGFDGSASGIFVGSQGGPAGAIVVDVGSLSLTGGALIQSGSLIDPQGGAITVRAGDSILIASRSGILSQALDREVQPVTISASTVTIDEGFINTSTLGTQPAGHIIMNVGRLSITGGGEINSSSERFATETGRGGDITITATESVSISGQSVSGVPVNPFSGELSSGIFSTASGSGPGGHIRISAPTVELSDTATISATSAGPGPGGTITLSTPSLTMSDAGFISASSSGPGAAGQISVTAGSVSLSGVGTGLFSDAGRLDANGVPGSGPGGDVTVTADQIRLADGATISATSAGAGPGGTITLSTPSLTMSDAGFISASSSGPGAAGQISVTASSVSLSGVGTGLFSDAGRLDANGVPGSGPGGDVTVTADQIRLADGATISATSAGPVSAVAGNINIVTNNMRLANSRITTDSLEADGGNISITAIGSELVLQNSQIVTSVRSGLGGGGNIMIGSFDHPFSVIVLDNGGIHADAFGGPGGNINLFSNVLLTNVPLETAITASSQLSSSGTISVNAFTTDVSGAVAELPSGLAQSVALLRASCAVRMAEGRASSLVVAGREGVPVEPGGFLPSDLTEPRVARAANDTPLLSPIELRTLRLSYLDTKCGG